MTMTIEQRLEADLKDAMRARDKARIGCIRQVKAKVQEAENAPGFAGGRTDAFFADIIGRYCKALTKSLDELRGGGERGAALVAAYSAEVAYLQQYLPRALSDEELAAAVEETLAKGSFGGKDAGRVLGQLMGQHKGRVEPGRAKAAIDRALAAKAPSP